MAIKKRTRTFKSRLYATPKKPNLNKAVASFQSKNWNQGESPVKVQKKEQIGNDVTFEASTEEVTPYDGAVQLDSEYNKSNNDAEYENRDELDSNFAGLSNIVSDPSTIRPTSKAVRNRFGIIMSTPNNIDRVADNYVVPNVKHVFEAQKYIEIIDTTIDQLRMVPKEIIAPKGPPSIETIQCYPGFGTLDGNYSDGYTIQTLPELGEPSLQVAANHTIVLMSRAYNYRNENNTRMRDGLSFSWKFNADGIGTAKDVIVGTGEVLRIRNAQLQQRGRYTLEVSNAIGVKSSKSYFVNVLGGLLKELEPSTIGTGTGATVIYVPTGNYIRDESHDNQVSKYDTYFDYIASENRWAKMDWINGEWSEDTTPGAAMQSVFAASQDPESGVTQVDGELSKGDSLAKVHGGTYFRKTPNEPAVYYNSPGGITYKFNTEQEYFDHRALRGLPQDWSGIDVG